MTDEPDRVDRPADDPEPSRTEQSHDDGALHDVLDTLTRINPTDRWVEILAAAILAFATIASAWSAYQATRWSGVQAIAFAEAGAARVESVRASDLADTELAIDVEYFAIWLDGVSSDDEVLTTFLEDRFRDEFSIAFESWLAADPFVNQDAPHSPFEMDEYELEATRDAEEFRQEAETATAAAVDANQTGDRYVLTTVLFASVLFFAGISTKFRGRWIKAALLLFGFAAFLVGVIILSTFPIE